MAFIRPFTTYLFNPISRLFVGWLPGFGVITYRGRKSGKTYNTPLNVFRRGDEYVVALTYGSDVQWVKNVIAAGGCELRRMGKRLELTNPTVFIDPQARLTPQPIRLFLRLMRVTEFMRMRGPQR
jgi:deazaflavin-dependent oxidoreductase (nitroreductase family)